MTAAYINRIATAVPPHDVHRLFQDFIASLLQADRGKLLLFRRMAKRAGLEHRFSFLATNCRSKLPTPARRSIAAAPSRAPSSACCASSDTPLSWRSRRSNGCLGTTSAPTSPIFSSHAAPAFPLPASISRGSRDASSRHRSSAASSAFMGCYAAINALKMARHIVRSERGARVLVVNIELCTLHCRRRTTSSGR